MAGFYSARSALMAPLHWPTLPPPHTVRVCREAGVFIAARPEHRSVPILHDRSLGDHRRSGAECILDQGVLPLAGAPGGPVAKFGKGRERAWTGSDLPKGTQPENHANPLAPRPTDKVCVWPLFCHLAALRA